MNKKAISFAVIGLVIGFIGGFVLANRINRDAAMQAAAAPPIASGAPPLTAQNNPQIQSSDIKEAPNAAMLPDVAEKLEKAGKEPANFEAQMSAGDMYAQIKKFDKALEFYEKANKIKPDDYQMIVKLGNANYDLKNYPAAEKWYEAALAKNPDDVNVRTDLGLTFYMREPADVDRAIKEYQISLSKKPDHELALQNLCAALIEKGDKQGLKETIAKLEIVAPQNPVIDKFKQELAAN